MQIDLQGASGAMYRFKLADEAGWKTPISGTYVYVRIAEGGPVVLFVDEANNLMTGITARWDEAMKRHGATGIFTRLHVSGAARASEVRDLIEAFRPVMNDLPPVADAAEESAA